MRTVIHTLTLPLRWLRAGLALSLSLLAAPPTFAQTPETGGSGELLLHSASGQVFNAVQLQAAVNMQIVGMSNRVQLSQSFTNTSSEWMEGTYVFPLPEDSAVNKMTMQVGNRQFIGEVRERAEAQARYEQAKREGRRSALVEQQRPNLFTQKVATIAPGETVIITLQYIQALRYADGQFSVRFPMTLTPRYDAAASNSSTAAPSADATTGPAAVFTTQAASKLLLQVDLNAGLPLANILSPSHAIHAQPLSATQYRYQITLADGAVPMDRDFVLQWQPQANQAPQAAVFSEQVGNDTYVQLMMLPPEQAKQPLTLARELLIVLDTSGSMQGTSIVQAKQSVALALSRLSANDHFNIIEFNSNYSAFSGQSLPATAANLALAQQWVIQLQANGGTEMLPALDYALSTAPVSNGLLHKIKQVVFITDGSVSNEAGIFRVIQQKLGETRLFTVGIGSAPNSYFMRKAASTGRGTFTYINDLNQVAPNMQALLEKLEHAVLADLHVEWPAGSDAELYPSRIPDLYLGEPLFVTARLQGQLKSDASFTITGATQGQPWQRRLQLNQAFAAHSMALPDSALAAYWGRQKIDTLLDGLRNGQDAAQVRTAVLAMALPYQLLSPYTSFIAEEKVVSKPANQQAGSSQVPNQIPQGQLATLAYPHTATNAPLQLLSGLVLALIAAVLWFFMKRVRYANAH